MVQGKVIQVGSTVRRLPTAMKARVASMLDKFDGYRTCEGTVSAPRAHS